jgi:putative ABC transport system permease protein
MRWPWQRRDEELSEEIRAHIAMAAREREERGESAGDARAAARREFGNVGLVKETTREMWGWAWLERLWQDVRFGLRMMRRSPGFTAVAVLTLALGIGATTAIFSVVDAVLLRPLPFPAPNQLVELWETESAPGSYPLTGADYIDWRAQNQSFEDMAVYSFQESYNASGAGEPERAAVVETQANFFSVLGVHPIMGRTFLAGEDQAGRNRVALLSYGFWQTDFGGDPGVLKKSLNLNGEHYDVVGVMPSWYKQPGEADLWVPMDVSAKNLGPRGAHHLQALGRIKPGITVDQARADLKTVSARLEKQYPDENSNVSAVVVPLQEQFVWRSRTQLWVMFGAVTLVLLIACVNVANLLLARSAGRTREIAMRAALGAGRSRVIRQLLTENVLLSACGALPGIGLAYLCVAWLRTAKGIPLSQPTPIAVDPAVLLFALGLAVASGILFGLMPALQTSRVSLSEVLNSGGRMAATATSRGRLVRNALVTVEIALSLVLLAGAGLLMRTFGNLRNLDIGVRADKVLTASVALPDSQYATIEAQNAFWRQLVERLEAAPGVKGAAVAGEVPPHGGSNGYVTIKGRTSDSTANQLVEFDPVTPDYFRVMGIPMMAGQTFSQEDEEAAAATASKLMALFQSGGAPKASGMKFEMAAVINQTMARTFWPNQDAVGKTFAISQGLITNHVIGVVGDTQCTDLGRGPMPQAYFGLALALGPNPPPLNVAVLGTGKPAALAGTLRSTVQSLDSSLAVFNVATLPESVSSSMTATTYQTFMLGIFAGLALLLASVGIYGVLSYVVTQRTNEIGIRMALGAGRGNVLWMILRQGLALTGAGIGVGVAGAYALTGVLQTLLYGVKPTDPVTFVAVTVVMVAVAMFACVVPVWRATRVDPMVALRYE